MCGIAGWATLDGSARPNAGALDGMLQCIAHRGPDDVGMHADDGVVLGHRRLSIIDVAGGHQPLHGARVSTLLIGNGEVYNYRELATTLRAAGHQFRTASDNEVAAHAYDRWGLDFLDHLDGMFALAIWDGAAKRLVLARDRMGEKPLHYTIADGLLIFASELSALLAHPAVARRIDTTALSQYLALDYVPAPRSIIQDVHKLPPACALVLERGTTRTFRYWQPPPPLAPPPPYPAAVHELRDRLTQAVRSRLVSDVPLGVFLSGGLDSSAVAALAAREGALDTFSIGFEEASFDESAHARLVARHIGSHHHERIVRAGEMPELVPALPRILDEPLADASILPTILLSRLTREHVTVALGGDGGDELFAGYPMHQAQRVAGIARAAPDVLHRLASRLAQQLPHSERNFSFGFKVRSFLRGAAQPPPFNHVSWMSSFMPAEQQQLLSGDLRGEADSAFASIEEAWARTAGRPALARVTMLDAFTYLPDDILMKVDRASMSVALEVRAPFLARSVAEFAFAVPDAYRMRGLTGKRLLRDAVRDLLPPSILTRPKKGFGVPIAAWLRTSLRPLLLDTLCSAEFRQSGLFDPRHVESLVRDHLERGIDRRKQLWALLVFELWQRSHVARPHATVTT